jgi:hypothetical protein
MCQPAEFVKSVQVVNNCVFKGRCEQACQKLPATPYLIGKNCRGLRNSLKSYSQGV